MTFGVEGGVPRALSIKERCLLNCFAWDKERDCFAPKRGRERAGRPGGGQGGGKEGVQPQCNSREMSATWWNPLWDEQIFGKYTEWTGCLACVVILQSLVTKLSLVRILKLNTASGVFSFRNSDILFLLQAVWFCLSLSSSLSQDRQTDRHTWFYLSTKWYPSVQVGKRRIIPSHCETTVWVYQRAWRHGHGTQGLGSHKSEDD